MKRLPTGIEDFEEMISGDYYYVDKTMLIKSLITEESKVTLFTRPRRFGKTLNMSMLKYFFEIDRDKKLFDGLKITEDKEFCDEYMGKYPVVSVSLKDVDGLTFNQAFYGFCNVIYYEARRFDFLLNSDRLDELDKEKYKAILDLGRPVVKYNETTFGTLITSLYTLTSLLRKHYDHKVVVLIDEYDVPLDRAHVNHFYDDMVNLIRKTFHATLKTNDNLAFGALTGCLRVSKESIFTGMNNLKVNTISKEDVNESFGFKENEIDNVLRYYNIAYKKAEVKEWYDGYKFGNSDIYCPWDVINYCQDVKTGARSYAVSYWANSSSNSLVREFVDIATEQTKGELEKLVLGEHIEKKIREELTYRDLDGNIDNLWSILYMTGYLTGTRDDSGNYSLWIPNKEVQEIYEDDIIEWFKGSVKKDRDSADKFYNAAFAEDTETMTRVLNRLLRKSVSVRDSFARKSIRENFYHGFILGLLTGYEGVDSNSENGDGYSDITITDDNRNTVIVFELKYSESGDPDSMKKSCLDALQQIEAKHYDEDLILSGMYDKVIKYGLAFNLKRAMVLIKDY